MECIKHRELKLPKWLQREIEAAPEPLDDTENDRIWLSCAICKTNFPVSSNIWKLGNPELCGSQVCERTYSVGPPFEQPDNKRGAGNLRGKKKPG